jgi:hypothetical protein
MNSTIIGNRQWKIELQNSSYDVLNTFSKYSTLDTLVNGIHLVLTFSPKTFSYGEVWQELSNIIGFYYEACGVSCQKTKSTNRMPDNDDLETTFIAGYSFMVFSIAPNKTGEKYHCHIYIYGIHNYDGTWDEWRKKFDRKMRSLKCVSSTGAPIYYEPVKDPVDRCIRDNTSNNYYKPLIEYVSKRHYPSLMNYFDEKNNKNFIYHYLV